MTMIARTLANIAAKSAARLDPQGYGAQLIEVPRRVVPRKGTREVLEAYRTSPVLRAVAGKISNMAAAQDWYATVSTGMPGQDRRVDHHVLQELLMGGNALLSGLQSRRLVTLHMLLVGESFEFIERDAKGFPRVRYPLAPQWVHEVPTNPNDPFIVQTDGRSRVEIPQSEMIWHKEVDPERPYERGAGLGFSLGDELAADELAAKHMANVFANRARPDLIISMKESAPTSPEARERFEAAWSIFKGPQGAGRPFQSAQPLEIHELSQSFAELELTQLRQFERDVLISVFGFPPELMGVLTSSNRATIDAAEHLAAKTVIDPILAAMRATYNDKLSPIFDYAVQVEYESPIQEDREFKLRAMQGSPSAFTIDEVREVAGLQKLPDGAGEGLMQPPAPALGGFGAAPISPPAGARFISREPQQQQIEKSLFDGESFSEWPDIPQALGQALSAMYIALGDDAWIEPMAAKIFEIENFFRQAEIDEFGLNAGSSFDLPNSAAAIDARQNAARNLQTVGANTQRAVRDIVADHFETGGGAIDDLRIKLEHRIFGPGAQADRVARTETVRAANAGRHRAHADAGIEQRMWLATRDSRTRSMHQVMDGMVVGINEPFTYGGASGMHPGAMGDAAHDINCRCTVIPIMPEVGEDKALTEERKGALWKTFEDERANHEVELSRAYKEAQIQRFVQAWAAFEVELERA